MTTLDTAVRSDDVDALRAALDAGTSPDMARGGWPLLAHALAADAQRCRDLLLERGADRGMAARALGGSTCVDALAALLASGPVDQAHLIHAFKASAVTSVNGERTEMLQLLAQHITEWDFSVEDFLPRAHALAMRGLWFALERIEGVDVELVAPLPDAAIERLRQGNLSLPEHANGVDLAAAKRRSLERFITAERQQGNTAPDAMLVVQRLIQTEAWIKQRMPSAIESARGREGSASGVGELAPGDRVVILRGRVAHGESGEVFWRGKSKRGPGERLGIRTDAGRKVFVGLDDAEFSEGE